MAAGRTSDRQLRWIAALIALPVFYLLSVLANAFPHQASGLQAIWLGNAALLGTMILVQHVRGGIALVVGGGLAASFGIHLLEGDAALPSALFAIANVSEGLIAIHVLRRLDVRSSFDRVRDVAAFVAACIAGTMSSATIGAVAVMLKVQAPYPLAWGNWFASAMLGEMLLTPMIMLGGARLGHRWRWPAGKRLAEATLLLSVVAAMAFVCFYRNLPLLFLIGPAMLFVAARLRASGAVASTAIVALIAVSAQMTGHGPIVHRLPDPVEHMMLLQLFLATIFLSSLPVAALLAERDAQADQARLLAARFREVVEAVGEVIFRTDMRGRWTYLNPAWETITGYGIAQSLGESSLHHIHLDDRADLLDRSQPVFQGHVREMRRVLRFGTRHGERWMELYAQPLRDADGTIVGATGTLRDIDDRKRLEEHVTDAKRRAEARAREATTLAATDELTGLANRRAFLKQLEREIAAAVVFDRPLAVALFDVDHFKRINDAHGHGVGDQVLRALAGRANLVVRAGDLVGRLGGEEFGVLMPGASALDAAVVAERLREAMERPREDEPELPAFTVSVGIAMRDERVDAAALLANADAALYRAKNNGRNQVRLAA